MNDGISTLESDAELRLSIMGSLAQEENRKTSSRVKWGQTRRMEQGVVSGRSLLGYDVKGGRLTVNLQGAEIVRLIFYKYSVEKKGDYCHCMGTAGGRIPDPQRQSEMVQQPHREDLEE